MVNLTEPLFPKPQQLQRQTEREPDPGNAGEGMEPVTTRRERS